VLELKEIALPQLCDYVYVRQPHFVDEHGGNIHGEKVLSW
jgi:hypothetical protein